MSDVERITTTERHAKLREQVAEIVRTQAGVVTAEYPEAVADAVLPFILQERVRVVEGLVATIKALPTAKDNPTTPHAVWKLIGADEFKADVLAVVEAARREATHVQ